MIRFKRPRYNRGAESFQEKVVKQLKSLESRIDIRLCPEIHQKLLIVDDREAWLGSANLNYRGMGGKRELVLWINDRQVVGKLTEIFNRRWMQKDEVCNYCPHKCIIAPPFPPLPPLYASHRAPLYAIQATLSPPPVLASSRLAAPYSPAERIDVEESSSAAIV